VWESLALSNFYTARVSGTRDRRFESDHADSAEGGLFENVSSSAESC